MQDKDVVIMMRQGKEAIALPGPGGYKIEWSPGTKVLQMEHAPSGHLVVPCDKFSDVKDGATESQAFWTDLTNPE